MKYYLGEITTYFGESQVSTLVKFKTDGSPADYLDKIASDFWGANGEQEFDTGLYDFGDKMAGVGLWQEITKEHFLALKVVSELVK